MRPKRRSISIRAGLIDDAVARLHGDSGGHGIGNNIRDGSGGFDGGHPDFAQELAAAFDEEFGVVHDAAFVADAENDKISENRIPKFFPASWRNSTSPQPKP